MTLDDPFVCDEPWLWGLPDGGPVGLVAMTAAGGERFTVSCDAPYARLMLDAMQLPDSPLSLPAYAFRMFRWGWMSEWLEAERADVMAWIPAADAFASEPFGAV